MEKAIACKPIYDYFCKNMIANFKICFGQYTIAVWQPPGLAEQHRMDLQVRSKVKESIIPPYHFEAPVSYHPPGSMFVLRGEGCSA